MGNAYAEERKYKGSVKMEMEMDHKAYREMMEKMSPDEPEIDDST